MTKNDAKFDFNDLDAEAAASNAYEFELAHPTNKKGLGVFVSVIGMESTDAKARLRKEINRERRRAFEAQRKGKAAEPQTIEEDEDDSVNLASGLVTGWRTVIDGKSEPVIHWNGKLEFTPANVTRWLAQFAWVRLQIIEAASDLGNFLGN